MKSTVDEWTLVTQVCGTYTDPYRDELLTLPRDSDTHFVEMMPRPISEEDRPKHTICLISATSGLKVKWDLLIIVLCLYNAFLVPLELGFNAVTST